MEEWRDIKGYEGLYKVSNLGNVRSLDRWVVSKDGKRRFFAGQAVKSVKESNGYSRVNLYREGSAKKISVHRIVALAFLPNPQNLPQVNHINEDKADNRAENLEWCTCEHNGNHGTRGARISKTLTGRFNHPKKSKRICAISDGKTVFEFPSIHEAGRQLGIPSSNIVACLSGKQKTAYGYQWEYA